MALMATTTLYALEHLTFFDFLPIGNMAFTLLFDYGNVHCENFTKERRSWYFVLRVPRFAIFYHNNHVFGNALLHKEISTLMHLPIQISRVIRKKVDIFQYLVHF